MSLYHPHLFLAAARHLQLLYVSAESCIFTAMASDSVHVALMSGRGAQVPASIDRPFKYVKLQAQNALQTGLGVLRDSTGRVLDEQKTVGEAGLRLGDSLTLKIPAGPAGKQRALICCHHGRWICCHLGSSVSVAREAGAAEERAAHPGHCLCFRSHSGQWICGHLGCCKLWR